MCDTSVVSFDFRIPTGKTCPFGFNLNLLFKSQGRYQARLVSIGAGTPGDAGGAAIPAPVPAPASPGVPAPPPAGLHHGYPQIHNLCNALKG